MRQFRALSLGAKLNLALLTFLLLLGTATSALIIYGFNRTQNSATGRSNAALEEQGQQALQAFVGGISAIASLQLEAAAEAGRRAALYADARAEATGAEFVDTSFLAVSASGHHYDPDPDRVADLIVISGVDPAAAAVQDDIAFSASLDTVFPIVLQGFEGDVGGGDFDPIAIVFISTNGVTRYYPPTGIHNVLPPDADFTERMSPIGPANNPERRTIWTPPYEDGGGQGQIITARTPVYAGDTFRGSLEVDVSIARLIDQVNGIRPTARGFAFYVDNTGGLFRTDAFDLLSDEAESNPELAAIIAAMQLGETEFPVPVETLELQGEEFFVAYLPIQGTGGSIAAAAPVSDVTAQAATITAGIDDEGDRTFLVVLAAMAVLFVAGLAGASYLNRRVILEPINGLVRATRAVAGGDFTTKVAIDREDELGTLAGSFNTMVEQLRESERVLERRVEDRTRELATLLEVSRNVASRIELGPLLESVLDQVRAVADYDRGSVQLFEDGMFTVLAVRDFGRGVGYETQMRVGMRLPIPENPIWSQFQANEPIILNDVNDDSELARTYRSRLHRDVNQATIPSGSFLAIPLISQDRIVGSISVGRDETNFYTADHARLARAIANQVAIAVENARLYETAQQRTRETEALLRADAELFRSLNLDTVLQSLVDIAVDILAVDKSIVVLHTGDIDVVRAARNYAPDNVAEFNGVLATMPHEEPPPENQTPQVYVDAPTQAPEYVRHALERERVASHISVPVKDATRMLGVFGVSFVAEHAFTEEEQRLYVALADRAAVAIQNAELYEKAQHAASLEERQRLARELHDSVSQALYGISLGARTARLRIEDNPATAAEPIEYVATLAEAGLAEMRALIFELRPESLETEGLVAAIEKQIASTQGRHQIEIDSELMDEPDCRLDVKEAMYRITQEALQNVMKHAGATRVSVELAMDSAGLRLVVADNGRGFDPAQEFPGHIGLHSMPERAQKLGGSVVVESAQGKGTRVTAEIPV